MVLSAGIVVWRSTGFVWLAVTAAVMVTVSGAAVQVPVLGNAGEVVLNVGLLLTVRRFLPVSPRRARAGVTPAEAHP